MKHTLTQQRSARRASDVIANNCGAGAEFRFKFHLCALQVSRFAHLHMIRASNRIASEIAAESANRKAVRGVEA